MSDDTADQLRKALVNTVLTLKMIALGVWANKENREAVEAGEAVLKATRPGPTPVEPPNDR